MCAGAAGRAGGSGQKDGGQGGEKKGSAHQAIIAVGRMLRAQSFFQAYGDSFFLMGAALLFAALAAILLTRPTGMASGAGAH